MAGSPTDFVYQLIKHNPDQCAQCKGVCRDAVMAPCGHSVCRTCIVGKLAGAMFCVTCGKPVYIVMPVSELRNEIVSVVTGKATPDIDIADGVCTKFAEYNAQHAIEMARTSALSRMWSVVLMMAILVRTSWVYLGTLVLLFVLDMLAIFVHADLIHDSFGFVGRLDDIFLVLFSLVFVVYLAVWQRRRIVTRSVFIHNMSSGRSHEAGLNV